MQNQQKSTSKTKQEKIGDSDQGKFYNSLQSAEKDNL